MKRIVPNPAHYQNPEKKWPPLCPWEDKWPQWAQLHDSDAALIAWTWGHLPPIDQERYINNYFRFKEGLKPELSPEELEQLCEAMLENWDLVGPVFEAIQKRTKAQRKAEK